MNFGWTQSFGGLGSGGGVKKPADPNDILQWLTAYDGVTPFVDRKDVVASPDYIGSNCRTFTGADHIAQSNALTLSNISCKWFGSFEPTDLVGVEVILSLQDGSGTGDSILFINGATIGTRIDGANHTFSIPPVLGVNDWELVYDATNNTVDFTLNGVSATQLTGITMVNGDGDFIWGASKTVTAGFSGDMWNCGMVVDESSAIDVIVTFGDSTNVGISATPPDPLNAPQQHLFDYYLDVGAWQNSDQGFLQKGTDPTLAAETWGAELNLGYNIAKKSAFIKRGVSGSQLGSQWLSGQAEYTGLVSQITSAFSYFNSQGYYPRITNVVMNLGINDANFEANANNFYDNFLSMWENLVSDTQIPINTPITLVRINDSLENTYAQTVQTAQDNLASSMGNLTLLPTESFETRDEPPVHYSSQGNVDMGAGEGVLYNSLTLPTDSDVCTYPLSGENLNIAYDVTNNGNHGIVTGTTIGAQDNYHHNALYGFSSFDGLIDGEFLNGSNFGCENFTQTGDYTATMETTNNTGGGIVFRKREVPYPVFGGADGDSYKVRYKLTGTSSVAIRIRSVLTATGNSTIGTLNLANAVIDGAWHELDFTGSSANDLYLQIGASISGDFNIDVEVEAFNISDESVIPALLDGSSAADGNPITNKGGYVHNGAECSIIQTDADTNAFGGASFWGDGASWTAEDYNTAYNHPNGANNLWFKWIEIDGVYHIREAIQYDVTREFTPAEVIKNENYCGSTPAGGFSALRDVDGELITDVDGNVIFSA
jgi:hypothetical protein